ncbi:signal peptidase I [Candidatus Epulonipiscium fishelsonii]|uniref:Signal peptidase I n=1 Tax=Candidatus Epulonipiscium fishelsonii TaxID=77094 RepID=A0ACC8XGT7_9FIRM|nr:signal peptidase I [Epulopiscium sp. SCG-B05WGA-EpuloA1]ONI42752.1 signal peptidase I [Epulopiscium sp. SCG-B11WGA-EpuloA1]
MNDLKTLKGILDFLKEPVIAVLVALIISQFFVAHTTIPTGSMISTINIDDHMLVSHIPFYYRNPKRSEIVIFKYGEDNLVKRVIGMPGETIDIQQGKVYINGEEINEIDYVLVPDVTHPQIVTFPYTIPEEHYFVMGDNRANSADSRSFGAISRDSIFSLGGYRVYPFNNIGIVD